VIGRDHSKLGREATLKDCHIGECSTSSHATDSSSLVTHCCSYTYIVVDATSDDNLHLLSLLLIVEWIATQHQPLCYVSGLYAFTFFYCVFLTLAVFAGNNSHTPYHSTPRPRDIPRQIPSSGLTYPSLSWKYTGVVSS